MGHYRIYLLDGLGKVASADWIDATDDATAVAAVKERWDGQRCEIWDRQRFVGTVDTRPDA